MYIQVLFQEEISTAKNGNSLCLFTTIYIINIFCFYLILPKSIILQVMLENLLHIKIIKTDKIDYKQFAPSLLL